MKDKLRCNWEVIGIIATVIGGGIVFYVGVPFLYEWYFN